jgi:uncharacterized membrane protein YsdA (DUF1294 family)/cold shock CspA family protein
MRYQGKIIKWNDEKGFGFVVPKGGTQTVFVHARAFSQRQRRPGVDAAISYELGSDTQGRCCAVNVRYADARQATIALRVSVVPMLVAISFSALLAFLVGTGRIPLLVAVVYVAASLATFFAYALDKHAAQAAKRRTPERTLFLAGLVGGWPGAIAAQQFLRHKSTKREFQAFFWLTVIVNGGALVWLSSPDGADMRALLGTIV